MTQCVVPAAPLIESVVPEKEIVKVNLIGCRD